MSNKNSIKLLGGLIKIAPRKLILLAMVEIAASAELSYVTPVDLISNTDKYNLGDKYDV